MWFGTHEMTKGWQRRLWEGCGKSHTSATLEVMQLIWHIPRNIQLLRSDQIVDIQCLHQCHTRLPESNCKVMLRCGSPPRIYNSVHSCIGVAVSNEIFGSTVIKWCSLSCRLVWGSMIVTFNNATQRPQMCVYNRSGWSHVPDVLQWIWGITQMETRSVISNVKFLELLCLPMRPEVKGPLVTLWPLGSAIWSGSWLGELICKYRQVASSKDSIPSLGAMSIWNYERILGKEMRKKTIPATSESPSSKYVKRGGMWASIPFTITKDSASQNDCVCFQCRCVNDPSDLTALFLL